MTDGAGRDVSIAGKMNPTIVEIGIAATRGTSTIKWRMLRDLAVGEERWRMA